MSIGDNIKRFRKENEITQKQLAKLIGKSKSSIEKYEANDVNLSVKVLNDISKALNVDTKQLIDNEISNIYLNKEELQIIYKLLCISINNFYSKKEINLKYKIGKSIKGDIE